MFDLIDIELHVLKVFATFYSNFSVFFLPLKIMFVSQIVAAFLFYSTLLHQSYAGVIIGLFLNFYLKIRISFFFMILDETVSQLNCPAIISRKKWGSQSPKNVVYQTFPVKYVIINHTVTSRCDTKLKCSNILLGIQNFSKNEQGADDIPYK